jgi:glutathione reductase (NADPH)
MKKHFDMLVIGAGSGGLAAAETAAQLGKQVALI